MNKRAGWLVMCCVVLGLWVAMMSYEPTYRHFYPKPRTLVLKLENAEQFTNVIHPFNVEAAAVYDCVLFENNNGWWLDRVNMVQFKFEEGTSLWLDSPSNCDEPKDSK